MTEAEAIVRALAAKRPPIDSRLNDCCLCMDQSGEFEHDADCPWRMAVEWTKANPTQDDLDAEYDARLGDGDR